MDTWIVFEVQSITGNVTSVNFTENVFLGILDLMFLGFGTKSLRKHFREIR